MHFYRNRKGEQPALSYLKELLGKKDKDSRIRARKIHDYINLLREYGTFIGEPAVKHIEGDIWELRPARDRVLFVEKHTQKTPEREKKRAREEYKDLKERGLNDE